MRANEETLRVFDHTVHYWHAGTEDEDMAIVLLHGMLGDAAANWHHVLPVLAQDYYVLAPDLPGFGGSTALEGMTAAALLGWLHDFLDAVQVDQAVLVGSSFGALVARLFAAAHPERVPVLVLANGGPIPQMSPLARAVLRLPLLGPLLLRYLGRAAASRWTLEHMLYVKTALTDDLLHAAARNARAGAALLRMATLFPLPRRRQPLMPTLILWGTEDTLAPLAEGHSLGKEIAGANVVEIENCGHAPHLEEPDIFIWQVRKFLTVTSPTLDTLPGL